MYECRILQQNSLHSRLPPSSGGFRDRSRLWRCPPLPPYLSIRQFTTNIETDAGRNPHLIHVCQSRALCNVFDQRVNYYFLKKCSQSRSGLYTVVHVCSHRMMSLCIWYGCVCMCMYVCVCMCVQDLMWHWRVRRCTVKVQFGRL